MDLVLRSRERPRRIAEAILQVVRLIPVQGLGEHLVEEARVLDVNLIRADADDWSCLS